MAHENKTQLSAAISPCPNDTFIFHGMVSGRHTLKDADIHWHFEDVETLNRAALTETYDISKLSFHAYLLARDKYQLLRSGAALGFGCGPVAVARSPIDMNKLASLRIAVPGELTTAHLLFRLFCPEATDKIFVRYDEIMKTVKSGAADVGIIIHEDRFVFEAQGLHRTVDLGEWWETETGAPIPLGCIAIRRTLADRYAADLDELVKKSIRAAENNPASVLPFIQQHAQQMDPDVIQKHVDTFVTDFSFDLGPAGDSAVAALERMAKQAGIVP